MIKHHEFSFIVGAPNDIEQCNFSHCKRLGDWCITVRDDHDEIMTQYTNICEQHIITAFIDAACGDW